MQIEEKSMETETTTSSEFPNGRTATVELILQSNVYKTTTLVTTQKWSTWTGGRLIKHPYKTITNQIWSLLAGF